MGGKYDALANSVNMRTATVIFDETEAGNLQIDHNDSHAATIGGSFALLLHGIQPKGTKAAKAWQTIRKAGGGYGKR